MWLTGAEERPGLAKVGRGAWGARGDGGPRSAMGPAPRSAGTNPAERHPRGRILVEAGGAPRRPLAAEPDRDGPRRRDTGGGGRGWAPGLWGPGPGSSRAGTGETGRALGKGKGKVLGRSPNSSVSVIPTCPKAQHATSYYTHQNSCTSGTVNSRET